jgi:Ca2+-binding EF-hand superfamily protein
MCSHDNTQTHAHINTTTRARARSYDIDDDKFLTFDEFCLATVSKHKLQEAGSEQKKTFDKTKLTVLQRAAAFQVDEKLLTAFKAADLNGDGKLGQPEMALVLEGQGLAPKLASQLVGSVFAVHDKSKDGFLQVDEFLAAIK